ncbi:hypothetical protein [Kitasatospora sp. Ki12]
MTILQPTTPIPSPPYPVKVLDTPSEALSVWTDVALIIGAFGGLAAAAIAIFIYYASGPKVKMRADYDGQTIRVIVANRGRTPEKISKVRLGTVENKLKWRHLFSRRLRPFYLDPPIEAIDLPPFTLQPGEYRTVRMQWPPPDEPVTAYKEHFWGNGEKEYTLKNGLKSWRLRAVATHYNGYISTRLSDSSERGGVFFAEEDAEPSAPELPTLGSTDT